MFMDFKLDNKTVVVIGGGCECYRKLQNFLDSAAKITVFSAEFSDTVKALAEQGRICLSQIQITDAQKFIDHLSPKPDLFLAVTDDSNLNVQLVRVAKKLGCIVYCVSDPSLSDFILPAVAKVGAVRIAVSTSGRSPAVASELRQRIERLVTAEDLLAIELQVYLREVLKDCMADQRARSKLLNETLNNVDVKQALREGNLYVAKALSLKFVQNTEATKT